MCIWVMIPTVWNAYENAAYCMEMHMRNATYNIDEIG